MTIGEIAGKSYDELLELVPKLENLLSEAKLHRDRKCGAHPALVDLNEGFSWPECDGGYSIQSVDSKLVQEREGEWTLEINALYEHYDSRGGIVERNRTLFIRDGRLMEGRCTKDRGAEDLADASNIEACQEGVTELFNYDGG